MKYPIVIPSRGRANNVVTIDLMPHELRHNCYLFVPREEMDRYQFYNKNSWGGVVHVESVSDYSHTISEKRERMMHWIRNNIRNSDYAWMMDDDLKFFKRKSETETNLLKLELPEEFEEMFGTAENMVDFDLDRFCAIGISMRQGNNNMPDTGAFNTRLIRCGLFNLDVFLAAKHNRLRFMGDFDVMIQMLKMGYDNFVLSPWAQDHGGTNVKGGCATSRDEAAMEESANALAAFHPDCVATKQKENKGGKLAVRTDVTIYWKKARNSAA